MPSVLPHPDEVAEAAAACKELLAPVQLDAWTRRISGVLAAVTGLPAPTANGVWPTGASGSAGDVEAALDAVAATGLPHGLQLRPASAAAGDVVAQRRGLWRSRDVPLMALGSPPPPPSLPDGLRLVEVTPAELPDLHAVLAAGFGADVADAARLVPPAALHLPGLRGFVGHVDGAAVVAGITIATGDGVAVFDVATAPAHQRRGYGAALTAHVVREGLASGARWAWLQATADGRPIYERLGFVTIERWAAWVSA